MRQLILIFLVVAFLLAACRSQQGQLKPIRPSPTPGGQIVSQPIPLTLSQLHEDPAAYQNQLIRVHGIFRRISLEPCRHHWGPRVRWALLGENLRLDSVGFEQILRLVPEGTPLTMDGWWRLYDGPLGCEKKPPPEFTWYLEAVQIVAPNPLPEFEGMPPLLDDDPSITATPDTETPIPTADTPIPGTVTATPTGQAIVTLTPTRETGTPPTATLTTTPGPTATPMTTPLPGTATVTPGPTPTASPTATGAAPPPPIATATPGSGYEPPPPPPPGTPTATTPPY